MRKALLSDLPFLLVHVILRPLYRSSRPTLLHARSGLPSSTRPSVPSVGLARASMASDDIGRNPIPTLLDHICKPYFRRYRQLPLASDEDVIRLPAESTNGVPHAFDLPELPPEPF